MFSHRFLSGFQTRGSDTSLTLNTFPKDQLRRQYEYYLPVAVNSWDANSSQPNFDAWRTSVRTPRRARNGEPGNSYIKQVVKRLGGGWTASSSGCERVFGTQKRSFEPHREDCGRDAVESELVLEGLNQVDHHELFKRARQVWSEVYGSERLRGRFQRRDARFKRSSVAVDDPNALLSENQFIKRRRREVTSLLSSSDIINKEDTHAGDSWTDRHRKEVDFNSKKVLKSLIKSYECGQLLPDEILADMDKLLLDQQINGVQKHLKLETEHRRTQMDVKQHQPRCVKQAKLYIAGVAVSVALQTACRQLQLVLTEDIRAAELALVDDVHNIDAVLLWALALGGGLAVTAQYLTSGLRAGNALAYKSSLATRRWFHCTVAWCDSNPQLNAILVAKVGGSKWRRLDEAEFLTKAVVKQHRAACLLFCTQTEQHSPTYSRVYMKLTADDALTFLSNLDSAGSCLNLCGM